MHATIPTLPQGVHYLMHSGFSRPPIPQLLGQISGRILATTIAGAIKLGFGFLVLGGLDDAQSRKAAAFFENNFVMRDPSGIRYYQGKFLIRTKQPDDDMNVYICFCPDPDDLYLDTPFGKHLNPLAIIKTEALDQAEADAIENDPERIDLVICFRDIPSILGLVQRPDVDAVQLLLENLVQITGNFGHLFKFGAIGKNVQSAIAHP
ncbi:MAG: hypothetical protein WC091_10905 [Sulfuricellaceae bacterium]